MVMHSMKLKTSMIYWEALDKYAVISTIRHSESKTVKSYFHVTSTFKEMTNFWRNCCEYFGHLRLVTVNLIGSTWDHKARINAPVNKSVLHAVPLQRFEITWEKLKICDSEILLAYCYWQSIRQSGVMLPCLGRVLNIIVSKLNLKYLFIKS